MVSIIMPTYNRAYIIEKAIQSVQRQTYKDWELIIVDDASTDYTKQLLEKYVDSKIHYYIKEENQGANEARNFGAAHAKGQFLAFLDSDNYWPDDRLEVQMQMVEAHRNERCFFYGKVQITNGEEVRIAPKTIVSTKELKAMELRGNEVDTNTLLISKRIFIEIGGFAKELPRLQDWEIVLRSLFSFNLEAVGCEKIFSLSYIQKNSISNNKTAAVNAFEFIIRNYLSQYLPPKEILDHLIGSWYWASSEVDLMEKIMLEMCADNVMLLPEIIHRLYNLPELWNEIQYEYRIIEKKKRMEELLYIWHTKNAESKTHTVFLGYFQEKQISTIAIYGLGKLGTLLYKEVKKLPVIIGYGIDREKEHFEDLIIKRSNDDLEKVDLMIVAISEGAEKIKAELKQNYEGKIMTLEELIFSI